jgi:hypothetical protein
VLQLTGKVGNAMLLVSIRCDLCEVTGCSRKGIAAHVQRRELEKLGWLCLESGGRDYCPSCREALKGVEGAGATVELANDQLPIK